MQRQPICVDRPSFEELKAARDRERSTSLVYEHLLSKFGIGVAEAWIEALEPQRADDLISRAIRHRSPSNGWVLCATAQSERIAKKM
jgi:hypothetical protein